MSEERSGSTPTVALNTKVEEDFVAPVTAMRGALEILRDFPDLDAGERRQFVDTALRECARLEQGIEGLASTVYAAGRRADQAERTAPSDTEFSTYTGRVRFSDRTGIVEIDFSGFAFTSSKIVNAFYDVIEDLLRETGRRWYFLINHHDCSVWPEAWVAFAQREKKIRENHSLGTARYAQPAPGQANADPNIFASRAEALARIEKARAAHR